MLTQEKPVLLDYVRGDATGLDIPAHARALQAAGEEFLTTALQRFGSLSSTNRVTRIRHLEPFPGGNSGHKVSLSLDYAHDEPGLHRELFVKFSRDFDDAFRDRRRYELAAEVRLARLSRLPTFPVRVPTAAFADFNEATGTGLIIMERIAFGTGNIEPLHPKCMDHELMEPVAYYRALFTALARLAAAHKAGRLSPDVETLFPFDPASAAADLPIPYSESQLRERIARYAALTQANPRLMPAHIATPEFIAQLERDAVRFLQHEATVKRFLHANPDFIALCHWNTNIDNAWFWRDEHGELQCGLLDWGMVRQMNVAFGLWGGLCGASLGVWADHLDDLLTHFVQELHAQGGPRLPLDELKLHLDLSVAMLCLALMMEAPALVQARLPKALTADGQLDPVMHENETARSFLHVYTSFLNLWQRRDFGASLDALLARSSG